MTAHDIDLHKYIPEGKKNTHWIAICSCGRWRSEPYREYDDAEKKGLAHSSRGDLHNRANAAADRGAAQLRTTYNHYVQMSKDPFVSDSDRVMWQRLAEELRRRVEGNPDDPGDVALF